MKNKQINVSLVNKKVYLYSVNNNLNVMIKKLKRYEVQYWMQARDSYESFEIEVSAISRKQSLRLAEREVSTRAKNFKVLN